MLEACSSSFTALMTGSADPTIPLAPKISVALWQPMMAAVLQQAAFPGYQPVHGSMRVPRSRVAVFRAGLTESPPPRFGHWRVVPFYCPCHPGVATCMLCCAAIICQEQPDFDRLPRSRVLTQDLLAKRHSCWYLHSHIFGLWSLVQLAGP